MTTHVNQEFGTHFGGIAPSNPETNTTGVRSTLKWGPIFGGAVAAIGVASMLYALGLAMGLSWIDPNDPASLRPSSIFAGIWMVVVSLVALFVGGYVSAYGANVLSRGAAALHGLVVWGLSVIAGAWLIGSVAAAVVAGGAAIGKATADAVGTAIPSTDQFRNITQQFGLSSSDLLAPVNERLRAAGKPEVSAPQLENVTRQTVQDLVRRGTWDESTVVQALASNTGLTQADATQVVQQIRGKIDAAANSARQHLAEARTTALTAAEDSGKAFWALFGALLLGMLAAVGGASLAGARGLRRVETAPSNS